MNIFLIFADFLIIIFSLLAATFLRFDFSIPQEFILSKFMFFIVYGLLVVFTFVSFGDYEEKWEYSSIREYLKTTFTFLSTNLFLGLFFYFSEGFFIPRTIFFTSIPISLILILSARVFIRGIKEFNLQQNNNLKIAIVCKEKNLHVIFERLKDYDIRGIFLEDRVPRGRMFKGIPIYYDISFLRNLPIDEVFIDKEISQDFYIKVLDLKPQNSIVRKIDVSFSYFEEFRIEDVIQREKRQINLEIDKDKIYLITGAGGSIGKSIAKELVNLGAKYLKLLDYNEENIHNLYLELLPFQNVKKEFILCDIKDKFLSKIVGEVDIIFHCAANKHVPYVEENKYTAYQ
ncbi:MAG: SDR family NAD(P)-dependent oxidoreductase, partial [bacterium]